MTAYATVRSNRAARLSPMKSAHALGALLAGFVSTLVFHQGTLAIFHAADLTTRAPYAMAPTAPFHVPAVVSLALWGGV